MDMLRDTIDFFTEKVGEDDSDVQAIRAFVDGINKNPGSVTPREYRAFLGRLVNGDETPEVASAPVSEKSSSDFVSSKKIKVSETLSVSDEN